LSVSSHVLSPFAPGEKVYRGDNYSDAGGRALLLKTISYRAVRHLIEHPPTAPAPPPLKLVHEHLRGADYFRETGTC
jgi:hypothetical protein